MPGSRFARKKYFRSRAAGFEFGGASDIAECVDNAHVGEYWPSEQHAATTVTQWLYGLHMAEVFSWPYQLLVFLLGLMIGYLSYSGIVIWLRKRHKNKNREFSPNHYY